MSKYDDLMKRLGRLRPNDFVQWLCPELGDISQVTFEDREFELTNRRVDLLYKVKASDVGEFLLHLEFQVQLKSDFSMRMHEYSTRIRREYELPVRTVAVFLDSTKAVRDLEPVDRLSIGCEVISYFHYTKIILPEEGWQNILAKGFPVLYPLIPLTKIKEGEEQQALQQATRRIEDLTDPKLRGELAAAFYLLGGYSYSKTMKKVIGDRLMQDLMQSKTYRELALVERNTGKLEGELKALTKILRQKFGDIPEILEERLQTVSSVESLDSLIDLALTTQSIEDFQAQLQL